MLYMLGLDLNSSIFLCELCVLFLNSANCVQVIFDFDTGWSEKFVSNTNLPYDKCNIFKQYHRTVNLTEKRIMDQNKKDKE